MKSIATILLLAALLLLAVLLWPAGAGALDHGRPVNIGALNTSWGPTPGEVGLRDGLVELGYREGEHFSIGTRFVSGDLSELPAAAKQLVRFGVDIIFAVGINAAREAQQVTTSIPVVFVFLDDPVRTGLVASYARPGGNITGVADRNSALAPKRLEVFKQMIPRLRSVLYVYDGGDQDSVAQAQAYRSASKKIGVTLVERVVRTIAQAQAALARVGTGEVDGILSPRGAGQLNIPGFVEEAAIRASIPTMYTTPFFVGRGGLASYAPALYSSGRQAARLVEKIMRGISPTEIPVEVNNDIEFAVNLKTAKALGIKIPPEVLYQATRIVR